VAGPIITNGDHAADALRQAFPHCSVLPWRDSLVDGPVPDLPAEAFAKVRTEYLAAVFGYPEATVAADFASRDAAFASGLATGEPIALWFETDLYDQLQLIDILARVAAAPVAPLLSLVQAAPPLPQHDLRALAQQGEPVSADDLAAAAVLWSALCRPAPTALVDAAFADGPLPAVRTALRRLLQELPAPLDGLSRIEREILRAIERGDATPQSAFRLYMAGEDLPFLGDAGFFVRLAALANVFGLIEGLPAMPLFNRSGRLDDGDFLDAPLALTTRGRDCLAGRYDLAGHPHLDRWVGGTHVTPPAVWRWDADGRRLIAPA
jgi:hypothetical protein